MLDPEKLCLAMVINHKSMPYRMIQHFVDVLRIQSSFVYIYFAAFRKDNL